MAQRIEIAAAVRAGDRARPRVVLDEHLAAIDAREGEIHAFNLVLADEARAAAAAVDAASPPGEDPGPLAGVPVALKDNMCTRGIPTTCSSKILEGWRPPYDATVVERLRAAGAVRRRQDQPRRVRHGLVAPRTRRSGRPATRTTPSRVPGGSCGGSAAAVAAGFAAVALGCDTGGSIRQPAALCGVVGVKPTYGVVSRYGLVAFASSLDQIGPFTTHRRRRRPRARGHRRPRPGRLDVDPRAGAVAHRRRSATASRGCASGAITDLPGRRRPRRRRPASRPPSTRSPPPAPRSSTSRSRRSRTASPPTTSSPRPRRRATWPATTACATACGSTRADTNAMYMADPHRRLRRRGQAAHHARHVRPVGRLLRRLLRQGAEGPHG